MFTKNLKPKTEIKTKIILLLTKPFAFRMFSLFYIYASPSLVSFLSLFLSGQSVFLSIEFVAKLHYHAALELRWFVVLASALDVIRRLTVN